MKSHGEICYCNDIVAVAQSGSSTPVPVRL